MTTFVRSEQAERQAQGAVEERIAESYRYPTTVAAPRGAGQTERYLTRRLDRQLAKLAFYRFRCVSIVIRVLLNSRPIWKDAS